MASTSGRRDEELEGVEFIMEDDGRITARDTETGVPPTASQSPRHFGCLQKRLSSMKAAANPSPPTISVNLG